MILLFRLAWARIFCKIGSIASAWNECAQALGWHRNAASFRRN